MAGNKRTSSQMDNGNDNPSPKTLDEILAATNTDDLQGLFEIPDPPSEEDLAMLNAFDFQAPPIDDNNNNNNDNNGTVAELATMESTENTAEPAKPPGKRRRKGDPEPDHSALVREKSSKSKRCGQACDRCHIRRFKCDEVKGGCLMCLRSGIECKMTNRVTGETMVRGGAEGVVINFDDIQRENEEVKEENEKLRDEIEQLRSVNSKLQSQLQYYYNKFSIGTIPGPSHAPVQAPMRDDTAQGVSFQGANGQDAQPDRINRQGNTNTQSQYSRGQDTNVYVQGTSHSLKTLSHGFQVPHQYLTGGAQSQTSQHESKNIQRQGFPNAKVSYTTAQDYPFNFPQPAPQSYLQPVVQFQGAGHQKADNQIPSFLNDPLGGIKGEDDTEVKFDLEPGFCWTPPLPATFPSLDLVTATKQTSTANPGDASTNFFTFNDSNNAYQAQNLSNQEILGLLLGGMEEGLVQQKQSQPPVHQQAQELKSDNIEVKTESPGNYNGSSHGFESSQGFGDIGPFV